MKHITLSKIPWVMINATGKFIGQSFFSRRPVRFLIASPTIVFSTLAILNLLNPSPAEKLYQQYNMAPKSLWLPQYTTKSNLSTLPSQSFLG